MTQICLNNKPLTTPNTNQNEMTKMNRIEP